MWTSVLRGESLVKEVIEERLEGKRKAPYYDARLHRSPSDL